MNRFCGNIFPNNFGIPLRIQLPSVSLKYGRESLYCRYQILNLDFSNPVNINITHIVHID